jgi:hypothetical protein
LVVIAQPTAILASRFFACSLHVQLILMNQEMPVEMCQRHWLELKRPACRLLLLRRRRLADYWMRQWTSQ